jgi:hypothetical protein
MQNEFTFNRFNVFYAALLVMGFVIFSSFAPAFKGANGNAFFMGDIIDLDTVNVHISDCGAKGRICVPLTLGQALSFKITDNGEPIDLNIMNGCDFDTMSAYTYSTLYGLGQAIFGPYALTSWPVGGQIFRDTFNTIPELVDSMNVWDPLGNWTLDANHLLITPKLIHLHL